jgi:CheY-like chemotaxis protein
MPNDKYVILCVDDDPDVLFSLKIVLESGGYAVVTAAGGKAGVRAFRESRPDLVLLDLMMEEVDAGTRALKEMQAIDRKVPVYLLSSRAPPTPTNSGWRGCSRSRSNRTSS